MMAKDSKCRWGNYFSFIILPFSIGLQTDPLVYLEISESMMARKKHSYHAELVYFIIKSVLKVFGAKVNKVINELDLTFFSIFIHNLVTILGSSNHIQPTRGELNYMRFK